MNEPESVYDNERLVSIYDKQQMASEQDLVDRLRERARIRRQIPGRKSVQENKPDRIADLLEEAANEIIRWRALEPFIMTDDALKRFGQSQYRDGYAQAKHDLFRV